MIDLLYFPWRVSGDDHAVSVGVGIPARRIVVLVGWGWDNEHPLRPWPWLTRTPTPHGHRGFCLSWCGLFLQARRLSGWRPSSEHLAAAAALLDQQRYRDQLQRLRARSES